MIRIGKRNAYYQAGRVAAIHIGNNQKNLPAVYFQIVIKLAEKTSEFNGRSLRIPQKYKANLEGGRLIPHLPYSFQDATRLLSPAQRQQCRCAFEADVINILAASLAEAKYVALCDNEVSNANLVYIGALKFYGGSQDLLAVDEYMDCLFLGDKQERNQKLTELFLAAYSFVNEPANWQAITLLAETFCRSPQNVFPYEELIAMLEPTARPGMDEPTSAHMGWPLESRQAL
jgi:hypothetical protein